MTITKKDIENVENALQDLKLCLDVEKITKENIIKELEELNISQDINDCLVISGDAWMEWKNETKRHA